MEGTSAQRPLQGLRRLGVCSLCLNPPPLPAEGRTGGSVLRGDWGALEEKLGSRVTLPPGNGSYGKVIWSLKGHYVEDGASLCPSPPRANDGNAFTLLAQGEGTRGLAGQC